MINLCPKSSEENGQEHWEILTMIENINEEYKTSNTREHNNTA